jgi:hypothetical protein
MLTTNIFRSFDFHWNLSDNLIWSGERASNFPYMPPRAKKQSNGPKKGRNFSCQSFRK